MPQSLLAAPFLLYRMLNSSTTDRDQQTADSLATFFHRRSSQCQSTRSQQYSLSKGEAAETESVEEYYFDKKQSECQFHKLDSFSTLSIGQSPYEVAAMERATYSYMQNIACQADCLETHKMKGEYCIKPSLLYGNADYVAHQVQSDHNQSIVSCCSVTNFLPKIVPLQERKLILSCYKLHSTIFSCRLTYPILRLNLTSASLWLLTVQMLLFILRWWGSPHLQELLYLLIVGKTRPFTSMQNNTEPSSGVDKSEPSLRLRISWPSQESHIFMNRDIFMH
ncbi:Hypothetical predicted protein [Olea europaea subsp. europaea]|uniref:Uncharacterized protein n=1 Tax=Olea europaea subsp. europaea TaxID=158383 RepID=A0A8S0UPK0_OLEEU|nr:Hypothetical predicted protein [Olea europaea subsp. europaea]